MEVIWETLANSERRFTFKSIFHDYDNYIVNQDLSQDNLIEILGAKYFIHDLYFDQIVELFNEMTISRNSNGLTDFYSFMIFIFKIQLYNKIINRDEAILIYNTYIAKVSTTVKNNSMIYHEETSDFIMELISYKNTTEEKEEFVYSTFLNYLTDLKFN